MPLAESFVRHFNSEFGKSVRGVDPAAIRLMNAYPWPGNVRELRNAIERAVLLAERTWVTPDDLPVEIRAGPRPVATTAAWTAATSPCPPGGSPSTSWRSDLLRQALVRANGNRTRAAKLLGMNRDRIRYRIQKFQLEDTVADAD